MYTQLGLEAGAIGRQAGSMAASFVAKTGTTMAITSLTSGAAAGSTLAAIGSMAGPIGAIIGVVVSFIMSMFGPDPKKPIFGLTIVVPEGKEPTLKDIVDYLSKPMFDFQMAWGLRSDPAAKEAAIQALLAKLAIPPPGAIVITSGGLPEAVEGAKKLDFVAISRKTATIAAPFIEVLGKITDPAIKAQILATKIPFMGRSKNYYFNIDKQKNPKAKALQPIYDQYKIVGGEKLDKALTKGFSAITDAIKKPFIDIAGIDPTTGTITDGAKFEKAFKPTAQSTIDGITSSPLGLFALLAGGYLLLR